MKNEFIPYELAVELKVLGFDERCLAGYRNYGGIKLMTTIKNASYPIIENIGYGKYGHQNNHVVKAPLYQQAFDWLREKHYLYAVLIPTITMDWTFKITTVIMNQVEVPPYKEVHFYDYSTYEEVRSESLKTMIQMIKEIKQ